MFCLYFSWIVTTEETFVGLDSHYKRSRYFLPTNSQVLLPLLNPRQDTVKRTHRRREEVLAAPRDHERAHGVQLDRSLRILRKQAGDVDLFALAQLAQNSVETDPRPDEVALIGPLALDESEAVADGALVADEEEAAGAGGVGLEFVALVGC